MPRHEQFVVIDRPVADVFAYMDDVSREREWQPHLREAEQMPAGPTRVGTRRRYVSEFLGRRVENTYVVRTYEPERHIVLESTPDSAVRATTEVRWASEDGGTRVTMSMEGRPSGALRFLPGAMLEAAFASEVSATLRRLRDVLEGAR